eukprot:TRINITY_DN13664_c0_g1_i2.p1 TRINITY_DN13664_c0_g1~~TRINITY_DN13664_c0_g1_i2.p1  ORF type:complete len:307 (-),score=35.14 TRINITY_DN13664_c0_g1_i2:248-1168(-)
MAPKKPPTRKQQEKDEQDRLQQEKEKQEQLDRIRAEREREQQEAEELARLELLRKSRLPDEAFRFRVNAVGWKQGNPPPRYHHVAVDLEGRLVVLAGCRGERLDSAYILDTDTKRWSQRPLAGSPPETYACHSYVLWNGTLYLYGGYGETGFKQDLFLLNLTGDWAWQKLQTSGDLPPFYGMSTVLAAEGGKMICFGGRANTQTLSNDTYVLDLGTFFWTKLTTGGTAPSARFSHCAAVHSNRMLVHGGIDALGSVEPTAAREDNSHIYALDLGAQSTEEPKKRCSGASSRFGVSGCLLGRSTATP